MDNYQKVLEEAREYIKNTPRVIIYTNSENFRATLQKEFPNRKIEILESWPDKSYPNLFFVYNVKENFIGKEPHGN